MSHKQHFHHLNIHLTHVSHIYDVFCVIVCLNYWINFNKIQNTRFCRWYYSNIKINLKGPYKCTMLILTTVPSLSKTILNRKLWPYFLSYQRYSFTINILTCKIIKKYFKGNNSFVQPMWHSASLGRFEPHHASAVWPKALCLKISPTFVR